ncbi:MAG: CHAD domain-containing protein [Myxococcota bacterium]
MSGRVIGTNAAEGVRRIALDLLASAAGTIDRLDDPDDAEGLHDFRVNIRRLRSAMRAYRRVLRDTVGDKWRRRLGDVARATNDGRDAEVQLEWVRAQVASGTVPDDPGVARVTEKLRQRMHAAHEGIDQIIVPKFQKVEARLRERLERYWVRVHVRTGQEPGPGFAAITGELVQSHADALWKLLTAIGSVDDERTIHEARVAGKRLRYLLEPVRDEIGAARSLVKWLKQLQDTLGELHDMQVIRDQLLGAELSAASASGNGATQPDGDGITALRRAAVEMRDDRYQTFERLLADGSITRFIDRVHGLARELVASSRSVATRRRVFLLDGIPPQVRGKSAEDVHHGWFGAERTRDRLTSIREDGTIRCRRVVEVLDGEARTVLDTAVARDLFDRLWRLTQGKRLRLRRYTIRGDDHPVWHVDRILGRSLVLAWVQAAPGPTPAVPDWIAERIVREVTGDAAFSSYTLAA